MGYGMMFINDQYPRAVTVEDRLQTEVDQQLLRTQVKTRTSIGSNATIRGGVTIGVQALIGAGVPEQIVGDMRAKEQLR